MTRIAALFCIVAGLASTAHAQTNPLWHEERVKNYLPHMTWPDVKEFLTRSDMALIPVPSTEQHGLHGPLGNDYYLGVETAKLIAQRTDIVVVPILYVGQSPYHMDFPGSITLSAETMERVYFEAAQSLIKAGFRRLIFYNSHTGNQYVTRFIVDRINQETTAVAIELGDGVEALRSERGQGAPARAPAPAAASQTAAAPRPQSFDRHGGVNETSRGLYLFPSLMQMDKAKTATLTLPPDLVPLQQQVQAGDGVASLVFLAEALKPSETGKHTSAAEMSTTGAWSDRDPKEATADQGRRATESFVDQAVRFIERWRQLRPNRK
jgi:creatinine amidohydrolase